MRRTRTLLFVVLSVISGAARAQSGVRPEILILGTYHMSNPARDLADVHADDVLVPKRQEEIAQLIGVLKRFRPTKIAVEEAVASRRVKRDYAEYRAGAYKLSADETEQIGYRLAKELGHTSVYPIDIQGDFPWEHVVNYAKANRLGAISDSLMAAAAARAKVQDRFLQSHTVLQMLEHLNDDSVVAADVSSYFGAVQLGDPDDEAGPDLVASWYQRNIRIYNNIVRLIDSPTDRILVIYGSGHLGWLRQDVTNDGTTTLRTLADLTRVH